MYASVVSTLHNADADRCVKIVKRADGSFGYSEFRRDPEDAGGWTLVADHPQPMPTGEQALAAARAGVIWLRDLPPADKAADAGSAAGRGQAPRAVLSLHNDDVSRCVDIVGHPDGTFGFKEFRRDPEDRGGWTLVSYNPNAVFGSQEDAVAAARAVVAWLRDRPA